MADTKLIEQRLDNIKAFCDAIAQKQDEIDTLLSNILDEVSQIGLNICIAPDEAPKKPTRLAVTMPDKTTIDEKIAADTFVKVIDKLGRRRVKALDLKVNGKDLMSTSEDDQPRRKLGGYYINVGTSTKRKSDLLEEIASKLGEPLKVEIIPKMR